MSESRLPIHPYAELFPPMTPAEFYRLCASILDIGLKEEIVLHEGKILDGRCRYLACLLKKVQPRFRDDAGECGSALTFVMTKNIDRRHLTEGQRALLAARLKPLFEEEARQRQRAALKRGSEPPVPPNLEEREKHETNGRSAQQAAALTRPLKSASDCAHATYGSGRLYQCHRFSVIKSLKGT
jgi:hypothetical protein